MHREAPRTASWNPWTCSWRLTGTGRPKPFPMPSSVETSSSSGTAFRVTSIPTYDVASRTPRTTTTRGSLEDSGGGGCVGLEGKPPQTRTLSMNESRGGPLARASGNERHGTQPLACRRRSLPPLDFDRSVLGRSVTRRDPRGTVWASGLRDALRRWQNPPAPSRESVPRPPKAASPSGALLGTDRLLSVRALPRCVHRRRHRRSCRRR